jgi:hypothetical protein
MNSLKDILALYRLVDWLMWLPEDMTKKFTQDLIAYEEEKKMPYITSAERIGIEKGRSEGRDEGMVFTAREMLLEEADPSPEQQNNAETASQVGNPEQRHRRIQKNPGRTDRPRPGLNRFPPSGLEPCQAAGSGSRASLFSGRDTKSAS